MLVQEYPSEHDAFAAEMFLIGYYGRKSLGTGTLRNLTEGGEGTTGFKFSAAQIKTLSAAHLGQPGFWTRKQFSQEFRDRLSLAHGGVGVSGDTLWCSYGKHIAAKSEFYVKPSLPRGHSAYCKPCTKQYNDAYYQHRVSEK